MANDTLMFQVGLERATKDYNAIKQEIENLAAIGDKGINIKISLSGDVEKLNALVESLKTLGDSAGLQALMQNVKNLKTALDSVGNTSKQNTQEQTKNIDAISERYRKLAADVESEMSKVWQASRSFANNAGYVPTEFYAKFRELSDLRNKIKLLAGSDDTEQLTTLRAKLSALKSEYKDMVSAAKEFGNAQEKANRNTQAEAAKAEGKIKKLGQAFNDLKSYMKQNGGSEEMRRLQTEIQGAIQRMRQLMNVGDYAGAIRVYERLSGLIRQATTATKEYESSQSGLASAVNKSTRELMGQSQVLNDLKSMALQYLSVWGAQSFVNNIIELGGQLEQQRLSIGAILQDTAQANHLFGQIKALAIKSPFGVQQLDAMTKQLSAYGFQYSELYEWTKRLADISAATGTSVDRLALALGHVRSEGALSGYTLRQFSMGNIPLLQKLSENLGKTKQEIRKMTRNKEIGYEDVLNVLKQLTDEGGMFFEAQETMAQALNAKFKNLRDSFQIMYSEMAEGAPGDALKRVAEILTEISKNWRVLMPVIIAAIGGFGMWKAATMAINYQLERTGKLLVGNALATSKYSVNQLRAIATTGRFTMALRGLGNALMSMAKFVFSPITLGFAAVEGLIYLWSKHNDEVRKAQELTKAFSETAVESEKNIAKQLDKIKPYDKKIDDSALKTGIDSMSESLKNYAVNGQEILNKAFGKDSENNVMSLAEKYQYLRSELEKTAAVYKEMKKTANAFEYGINETSGSWFDENVETDLTQYANSIKKFEDDVTRYTSKYGDTIKNAIDAAVKADPEFAKATERMTSYGQKLAEFWENADKYKKAVDAARPFFLSADSEGIMNLQEGYFGFVNKKGEAMKELDKFFKATEEKLKEQGYKFEEKGKHLSEAQVGNLLKQSKEWMEKHPEWENIYDVINDKLDKRWGIKVEPDPTPIEDELPKWIEDFQKELDGTGITLTANMNMEQIVDEMKKAYDKAQTTINKLGPIALQARINIQGLTDEDIEQYNDPTSFLYNPELYNTLKDLKKANTTQNIVDAAAKKRGLQLKGMKKDGSHKSKKERQNQEAAKAVREQVRVIKEAADAYQYWRDKVGDRGAWEHVKSEFGDVIAKIGITAENIEDVQAHLNNISKMKEYMAITDKKVKTEIDKEIAKENDQFIRKDFERDTERFLSQTQIELDNLTHSWELFNSVREATGNVELAVQLSGADYASGQNRNLADAIKDKIERDFASVGAVPIPFDVNMSDEKAFDQISKALPKEGEDRIKGIVEEYKKWRDLQREVIKNDITTFVGILSGAQDYQSQISKINSELAIQKESLEALYKSGEITQEQYDKALESIEQIAESKIFRMGVQYTNLMNHYLGLSREAVEMAAQAVQNDLNKGLKAGSITAQQYAEEMAKLEEIVRKFKQSGVFGSNSDIATFIKGGVQGLLQKRTDALSARRAELAEKGLSKEEIERDALVQKYKKAKEAIEKYADSLNDAAATIDFANDIIKGVGDSAKQISDMLDALGNESAANAWSDIADNIGAISSGLSSLSGAIKSAANGDIGGTLSGLVGTVTSPITAFAQLHDKKRERQIEELKREISKIDNTLNLIKSIRERELGYNSGNLRRQLAAQYKAQFSSKEIDTGFGIFSVDTNPAATAMYEYYSRGGLEGNGYQQELEALKKQRKDYQEMYETERDKKKSSAEALEEYKQKMAELDVTIMNYAKDLANELYGIDLKGWAEQIGDALMTAFENGEDAAKAFKETVQDIVRQVLNKMLSLGIIEPMMERLQKKLFGENGQGGSFDAMNPEGTIDAAMQDVAEFFGKNGEGQQMIEAAETFYKRWQEFMESQGMTLKKESSGGTSSVIKSISEQTADLLAAYINSIRADVSVDRAMIAQYFPMYYAALTSGNASLRNIENHTSAIMNSNDAIMRSNQSIFDLLHRLAPTGTKWNGL